MCEDIFLTLIAIRAGEMILTSLHKVPKRYASQCTGQDLIKISLSNPVY